MDHFFVHKRWLCYLLLLLLLLCCGCSRTEFVVMSYNVQNLFDDVADGSEYAEYLPGKSKWNSTLYARKMQAIARVIREAVPGGPDLVALQEVENLNALERLNNGYLQTLAYEYAILIPVANSATNVALLSRVPVLNVKNHLLAPQGGNAVRGILEVTLEYRGLRLHVFNNHWKSKTGGAEQTEPARLEAAALLRSRIITLLQEEPAAEILAVGDFNERPDEYRIVKQQYQCALLPAGEEVPAAYAAESLFLSGTAAKCGLRAGSLVLYEPWYEFLPAARGSYYYQQTWQALDHILLSPGLFDEAGLSYAGFRVVRKPFMLNSKSGAPLAWRNDGSGYSDHLPVIALFTVAAE